jgi:Holliday junction resolvase RusA-like endonuclease
MQLPFEILVLGRPASVNDSSKKKAWKRNVRKTARLEKLLNRPIADIGKVATGETMAKIFWFPPGNSYADVDNGVKWTIDALNKVVFDNDKHIQRVVAHRFKDTPGSSFVVQASNAAILLKAVQHQTGLVNGTREYATAIKIESYSPTGGVWW